MDSPGEIDFIFPYLISKEEPLNNVIIFLSKNVESKLSNDIMYQELRKRIKVYKCKISIVKFFLLICILLKKEVWFQFNFQPNKLIKYAMKFTNYNNIVAYPHSAFHYWPFKHKAHPAIPEYTKHIPLLIQDQRYAIGLNTKLRYHSFIYTGFFHESSNFIKFVDMISTKKKDWPKLVIFSYLSSDRFWPLEDFINTHENIVKLLDDLIPINIDIGIKYHPRASSLPEFKSVSYRRILIEHQSAFLLARNAKFVVCLGPSSVVYAVHHMNTPYMVFYDRADLFRNFKNHESFDSWFDPNFKIPLYENFEEFKKVLINQISKINW